MSETPQRRAVSRLCFAEQILVWGTRAWLTGSSGQGRVRAEFGRALGAAEGHATAAALGDFLAVLNSAAVRTMYIGPMSCRMVWPDEERILAAIRYLHAERPDAALRVLDQVLPPAAQRVALEHAGTLAGQLAGAGYRVGFGGPLSPEVGALAMASPGPTIH